MYIGKKVATILIVINFQCNISLTSPFFGLFTEVRL